MARYIDADALIKYIFPYDVVDQKCYSINAKAVYEAIKKAPAADVVPKSEVDLYRKQVYELEDELAQTYDKLETAKAEIAREIFEEIKTCVVLKVVYEGEVAYDVSERFAEIKKKYTEGET